MPRHAYVHLPARLVIFFSYKAGNTSLVDWLCDSMALKTSKGVQIKNNRALLASPAFSVDTKNALELHDRHGFHVAILSRNPYDRIVSGYVNKFVRDGDKWLGSDRKHEVCATQFLRRHPEMSFKQFLISIQQKKRRGRPVNPHFDTQYHEPAAAVYKEAHVLHLETIQHDLQKLSTILSIDLPPFPHARATHRSLASTEKRNHTEESWRTLAAQHITPDKQSLLTPECARIVQNIYAKDFSTFGYQL